jgi:hypothetical protein
MERVKWIMYKEKEILFADFSLSKSEEDVISMTKEVNEKIKSRPKGSSLYIVNMADAYISPSVMGYYKESGIIVNEQCKAWACVGMSKIKSMIFDLLTKTSGWRAKVFETIQEGKDYVVSV